MNKNLYANLRRALKMLGFKGVWASVTALVLVGIMAITVAAVSTQLQADVAGLVAPSGQGDLLRVVSVVDGDTIKVDLDPGLEEKLETVRLIGIDAPELAKSRVAAECMANESRELLDSLLRGKSVRLEPDNTQADRDRYDRALRYVFVDGQNAAEILLAQGLALEYTYNKDYAYKPRFLAAQESAKQQALGVWSLACES